MFFIKNGKTNTRAQLLSTHSIPKYLILGHLYERLTDRALGDVVLTPKKDTVLWQYTIQDTLTKQIYRVHTPHTLPERFWVRAVIGECIDSEVLRKFLIGTMVRHNIHYEIFGVEDEVIPIQTLRDQAPRLKALPQLKTSTPSTA
jgi:hypothetical protein